MTRDLMLRLRTETLRQKSMPNFETFCACQDAIHCSKSKPEKQLS